MRLITRKIINNIRIFSIGIILILMVANIASACTGFTASNDNKILAGINEDWRPYRRYVEIFPPDEGKFGKIFFCYQANGRQQAMNDQGLFYDGYWAPHLDIQNGAGKPRPYGWMIDEWMEIYSTVDEIIDSYNTYNWRDSGIEDAMLFFIDAQGNSVIIEGDEIIYETGNYQVVTNFYQSHPELGGYGFDRYETAINMLENMDDFSMEYFRDICDATHQEGAYPTIYSLVCDLTKNIIHYYYGYDYDNVWEINLTEEFEFGIHTYNVLDVFNNHNPSKPNRPNGVRSGSVNTTYEYTCEAVDIDGDKLYYKWDWGNGNISNWIGPYEHDETCLQSHQWSKEGEYQIRVMVRDQNGGESEWSNPTIVSMPKNKMKDFSVWNLFENYFNLNAMLNFFFVYIIL
jgi:hypothetical protein